MASSGNFPLWSPLFKGASNLSKGNTRFDGSDNARSAITSLAIPTGTKFYVECLVTHANYYNIVFGIANPDVDVGNYIETDSSMNGINFRANTASSWDTCAMTNGSRGTFSSNVGQTSARVLAMTVNRVDNEIKMYLDNTLKHTISISATEVYHIVCSFTGGSNSNVHMNMNCGHDSTGAGDFSAASNADENGFGEFQYSPPAGFLALCSANLPVDSNIDPAGDDGDTQNPTKHFGVLTWDGDGGTLAITGLGFQPDLVWGFARSGGQSKRMVDSSRGGNSRMYSDTNGSEDTSQTAVAFDSDGITAYGGYFNNDNGKTSGAWCWKANGGTTSTNTSGTITSTVQANTVAGFSIITYSGNGTSGATVGHGLGKTPAMTMIKQRNATNAWNVWHQGNNSGDVDSFGELTGSAAWYQNQGSNGPYTSAPTSTLLTLTGYGQVNSSTGTYVGYIWSEIEGYSAFGNYKGNGDADGPYIYTGFRPRLIFFKNPSGTSGWTVVDTNVYPINTANGPERVEWNSSSASVTGSSAARNMDILANGVKIRSSNSNINTNDSTYVFGAWADVPFKYNNTHP